MRKTYIFFHWALTLIIAPVTSQLFHLVFGRSSHEIVSLLEVYPITLLFSIAFSMPTLIIYVASFNLLARLNWSYTFKKLILITVSVLGIFITQSIIGGSLSKEIIIAYAFTALIVGFLLRLKEIKVAEKNLISSIG